MKTFKFWQKWILICGIIVLLMGLTFPIIIWFNIELDYINKAFWKDGNMPTDIISFRNWLYGTYCALSVAFGMFIIFIAAVPFKRKEKWAWICLAICFTTWLAIDTIYSLTYEVYSNASNNFILYLILILPLVFTGRYFFIKKTI